MGPEGAAAAGVLMVTIFVVIVVLVTLALTARRNGASSLLLRAVHGLTAMQCSILALGVLLPKSMQRALAFRTTGRWLVVTAAAVGVVLTLTALSRHEPGALRWLLVQLFIGVVFASFFGEVVFGVFRML